MFDALETGFGLDFVLWLQNMRNPVFEMLVRVLDLFGEELLYIAVIALIYWLFSQRLGMRLVFILLLATLVTAFAKDIFATKRPYEVSALVNELVQEETYGIPSGHVLISLAVWGYLAFYLRRPWVWILTLAYVLLQSLGRMMAGAHYPQDVFMAWLLGGILLFVYSASAEKVAQFWEKSALTGKLTLVAVVVGVLLAGIYGLSLKTPLSFSLDTAASCPMGTELAGANCLKTTHLESYFTSLGLLLGALASLQLMLNFKAVPAFWRRGLLYGLGLVLAITLLLITGKLADAISETGNLAYALRTLRYALVSFAALGIWPLLALRFGLLEKSSVTVPSAA